MLRSTLSGIGEVSDGRMTASLLDHGGFLILIDGLNEVDQGTRAEINTFVNDHRHRNMFCLTSQVRYEEFSWMSSLTLPQLDKEQIGELVRCRLDPDDADQFLSPLNDEMELLYGTPQHLEFAIEHFDGSKIHSSVESLYSAVLSQILVRAHSERDTLALCKRSFVMHRDGLETVEGDGYAMPTDLREKMLSLKLIVRSGSNLRFRHELVRSYLAGYYLSTDWSELLETQKTIDAGWITPLLFAAEKWDSSALKLAVFGLLDSNPLVAGRLFQMVTDKDPERTSDWKSEFSEKFTQRSLDGSL